MVQNRPHYFCRMLSLHHKHPSGIPSHHLQRRRRLPAHAITPKDQAFICLHFDGSVYIDHNTCFGSVSSHAMLGRCTNGICTIFKFHGVQDVIKWVNDFMFFRYPTNSATPWSYSYNSCLVDSLADVLGWSWAPKKHSPFAS